MEPVKINLQKAEEDLEVVIQLDDEEYQSKAEVLTAFKKSYWGLVCEIREHIDFDEETPTNKSRPDIFSLMMGEPPQEIMPAIRAALAFIHDDDDTYAILNSLTWDSGKFVNLIDFARMRERNFAKLKKMIDDPEQNISKAKIETLKAYVSKNLETYELIAWKHKVFLVPYNFWKIIV
jgi:hypothetical protein